MAYLNLTGKTPELRAVLTIQVKGEIIYGELNFIIWFEISSYPYVFLDFRDLIMFRISYVEAYCQFIFAKGFL